MSREYITDPLMTLEHIRKHEVSLVRTFPWGGVNWVQRTRWLAVSPKLMRHLIGAGLVEKPTLRWSTISWCYRLTSLGETLVFHSSVATISIKELA